MGAGASKYEEYDWDELPLNAKDAAKALGYTKKIWDKDDEPEVVKDYDWDELTKEQKKAAKVLGWNQKTWDTEE